jgi:gliding motility-associated-like protein
LNVNGGNNFTWSPSTGLSCTTCPNPVASPTATTTYSVTVSGSSCINGTGVVTLNVTPPPTPSIVGDVTICKGGSGELYASGGNSYSWFPSVGLSCTNCPNSTVSLTAATTYTLVASSIAPNCFGVDTVTVFVIGDCEIYVPTGFSPNGDNNNDVFYIFGGDIKELDFKVYNRWGQIVYETKGQKVEWDGTHNGKPVQSGVYAYTFSVTTSKEKIQKSGNITVIR